MENQRISLFKQKNRWGMTIASIVLCLVVSPVLGLMLFLPQIATVLPVVLMALLGFAGPVSAAACSAVLIALCASLFGVWGAVVAALFFVPVVIVSALAVEQGRAFWPSVAVGGVAMFASMGAVMALLSFLAGSDIVSAISQMTRQMFDMSGALGDSLLSMMMQLGLITAQDGSSLSMTALDSATREQLVSSIVMMMDSVLRLEIPMQMATGSVAAGVLGQAVLRRGLLSRGDKVDYPPLRTWMVPSGWGRVLGITLVALYLLAMLVPQVSSSMYYVFSGVFEQVFALQGIAALCYFLHERGKSRTLQGVVFVLGYFLLRPPAILFGIADQAFDFSHRRAKIQGEKKRLNPFDPRSRS
ncbi:MAG TPA: DUF2232 domain-containing protein [Candidatus Ventricola intestinavium]|nr:DUF2232 domain-containing protein [Candidatus Ventricola intestinavium]